MKRVYLKNYILYPMIQYILKLLSNVYFILFAHEIKFKSNYNWVVLQKAHENDACYDLQSVESRIIYPNEHALINTGLILQLPKNFEGQVRSRSGLAAKKRIHVLNSPGTIDSGYRDEVKIILMNSGSEPYTIGIGDRIAQIKFEKVLKTKTTKVSNINSSTERGMGGFGSSGK
jgi:dUTP pyrophosphatase